MIGGILLVLTKTICIQRSVTGVLSRLRLHEMMHFATCCFAVDFTSGLCGQCQPARDTAAMHPFLQPKQSLAAVEGLDFMPQTCRAKSMATSTEGSVQKIFLLNLAHACINALPCLCRSDWAKALGSSQTREGAALLSITFQNIYNQIHSCNLLQSWLLLWLAEHLIC